MYKREHLKKIETRINEPRRFIQTIIGPRQVGKTTLMKQLVKKIDIPYDYISADDITNANTIWIEQQWEVARIKLNNSNAKSYLLIIDEIQKIKNWSNTVKHLWDYDTFNDINLKVILLGSAVLTLQKGLSESLAGRFEIIKVSHWTFNEMQAAFGFTAEQFVWFGGYPGAAELINDESRWKDYVKNALIETTISKDILMMTRVDKPALLKRLFELGANYSGQILSYTKILGQILDAGNTTTLSHYLNLLDSAGMLCGIEKFSMAKIQQKASSPKFQIKNTALMSALSDKTFIQIISTPVDWGRYVESAIGAHLLTFSETENYKVYYWRYRNNEVDFILQKNDKLIGIEIKGGQTKPTKGMEVFKKQYNPYKILLVGTTGLHWKDFLKINPNILFD